MQAPPTTITTNIPAPSNDPMAIVATEGSAAAKAAMAEKISGDPLPRATKVTPATLSESDQLSAIRVSAGTKKPSAVIPSAKNKYADHNAYAMFIPIFWFHVVRSTGFSTSDGTLFSQNEYRKDS